MKEFESLVAVVTGGASGIGAAIATRLRSLGATVAVLDLQPDSSDSEHFTVRADIGDDESVRAAIDAVVAAFGRIDVVVNNAGIGAQGTVADNADEEWLRVLNINVVAIARVTRAALPWLLQSPSAAIVNMSSVVASTGIPQRALYSASKGAVLSLSRAMAADHLREGIRVNCVCPGTSDTPWIERLLAKTEDPAAERAALKERQPHGRLVAPGEVADAVAYLASPRSGSTTGISLTVDGGLENLRLR